MSNPTVQTLLHEHLAKFAEQRALPLYQLKALENLSKCRTSALGGHAQYCENHHLAGIWYNSCRQRFCPQCRGMATEEWLLNTKRVLLDCPHHHVVFTIPSELNIYWQHNLGTMRDLLFKAVQETLKAFSQDVKYLNAMPGILCALHTWGRNLCLHPHIHVLITHGGVNKRGEWVTPRRDILFPQKPVMQVFRGKLRSYLIEAINRPDWRSPPGIRRSKTLNLLNQLGRKAWVVNFSERYEHAEGVASYLSRYIKSGPLKNYQIKYVTDTHVRFVYFSHRSKKKEAQTIPIKPFLALLAQHIPESGKPTVRYNGLYSAGGRGKLNKARTALGQVPVSERVILQWQAYLEDKWERPSCPICGGKLISLEEVPSERCVN